MQDLKRVVLVDDAVTELLKAAHQFGDRRSGEGRVLQGGFPLVLGLAGAGLEEGCGGGVAGVVKIGGEESLLGAWQPFEIDEVELIDDGFLTWKLG